MRFIYTTGTSALCLLFCTSAPAYSFQEQQRDTQDKHQDKQEQRSAPPGQQERRQEQPQEHRQQQQRQQQEQEHRQPAQQSPQQRQHAEQPQQQERQAQPHQPQYRSQQEQRNQQARPQQTPYHSQQQASAWNQQRGWAKQGGGWQAQSTWQQSRARQWERDSRSWAQRGGYGGYYIPQASFGLYFGNQHWFRIQNRPVMYMGYPRFYYRGFSFMLVDPWPEYWQENWYQNDDVYVDYDNGYYLHNRRSPGIRLAITVAL